MLLFYFVKGVTTVVNPVSIISTDNVTHMIHDIFSPPVASRILYIPISCYEIMAQTAQLISLQKQLNTDSIPKLDVKNINQP
jgi:hypothetical protein